MKLLAGLALAVFPACTAPGPRLELSWMRNILTVHDPRVPGGSVRILYLEAYCRPGSTARDWGQTVIGHRTELLVADRHRLELRCKLKDGVVVDHVITSSHDAVDFRVVAHNPTATPSLAHWAQPCIRVGEFTGTGADQTDDAYAFVPKCFVFIGGRLQRMPTADWATTGWYTPGQEWAAPGVNRADVNPRPLNPHTPSNGLIGCFSADESMILATAWQPYQELFQGVVRCIHSDFRIGGLAPGETKTVRGKLYLVTADVSRLLRRYRADFGD